MLLVCQKLSGDNLLTYKKYNHLYSDHFAISLTGLQQSCQHFAPPKLSNLINAMQQVSNKNKLGFHLSHMVNLELQPLGCPVT